MDTKFRKVQYNQGFSGLENCINYRKKHDNLNNSKKIKKFLKKVLTIRGN